MHDCPFCLQNEDSQEEADDAALQEMEIEAAMEAEAVAEGVKRKTREEAASPVRAGGGPAGKKLATNASPPAGQRSPVPPTQRSPSPESPPYTQGGSEAARLSIPSFGIDIYDLSRTSKASTTVKDPMHDAMSEYLACMDEAQSLSLLHTKSTYQGLGSPEASYQTVLNAALKDPRERCGIRLCLPNSRSAARAFRSQLENHCPQGRLGAWDIHGADCSLMRSTDVAA